MRQDTTRHTLALIAFLGGTAGSALLAWGSVRALLVMSHPNVGMVGSIGALAFGYLIPALIALPLSNRTRECGGHGIIWRRVFLIATLTAVVLDVLFLTGSFLNAALVGYERVVPFMARLGMLEAVVGGVSLPLQTFFVAVFGAMLLEPRHPER